MGPSPTGRRCHPRLARRHDRTLGADRTAPGPGAEAGSLHRLRGRRHHPSARTREGVLAARLPRRLRGRPAQPGPADPLRDPQRARRRRRRADLRALDRPRRGCSGSTACRCSPSTPTAPAGDFDMLAFNLSSELVFTNVLEMIDLAGVPVRAADRRPSTRWSWSVATPRSTPSRSPTSSTSSCSARARRSSARSPRSSRRGSRDRARRVATTCCGSLAQVAGVYVPSLYDVIYDGPAIVVGRAALRRRPGDRRQAHRRRPRRLAVPEAPARAAHRGRPRPPQRRGLPRLHARLPVLPGGHDHPSRARAARRPGAHDGRRRACAAPATTRSALTSLSTADFSGIESVVGGILADHAADLQRGLLADRQPAVAARRRLHRRPRRPGQQRPPQRAHVRPRGRLVAAAPGDQQADHRGRPLRRRRRRVRRRAGRG